eukprot:4757265-Prymnesium_polylepis.1
MEGCPDDAAAAAAAAAARGEAERLAGGGTPRGTGQLMAACPSSDGATPFEVASYVLLPLLSVALIAGAASHARASRLSLPPHRTACTWRREYRTACTARTRGESCERAATAHSLRALRAAIIALVGARRPAGPVIKTHPTVQSKADPASGLPAQA